MQPNQYWRSFYFFIFHFPPHNPELFPYIPIPMNEIEIMNEWGAYYSPPFLLTPATIFASPRKLWAYRWNVLIGGASARWHVTVSVGSLRGGRRAVFGYWEREREKEEVLRCIYFSMATVIADFSYSGLFLMLSEGVIFYLHNMLSLAS